MIYRRGWVSVLHRSELEKRLKEGGIENSRQVADFLCGGEWKEHPQRYEFQVAENPGWAEDNATFVQRVNRLWFVPLYILTIPFQWLFWGRVGLESNSKVGNFIHRLTGIN